MAEIRVEVTAEDIAAAPVVPDDGDGFKSTHPDGKDPVELAIARATGRDVNLDSDGPDDDEIATIGAVGGRTCLVVSTAPEVAPWIERYYRGEPVGPFSFDIEIEDWLVDLLARASTTPAALTEAECAAVVRRNIIDRQIYACGFSRADDVHGSVTECEALRGEPCFDPAAHHEFVAEPAA